MAALTLIIVGKYFLPVFLKNGIYTMPEFLQKRYGTGVRTVMAIFWLALYVFVNLTLDPVARVDRGDTVTGIECNRARSASALFALAYRCTAG